MVINQQDFSGSVNQSDSQVQVAPPMHDQLHDAVIVEDPPAMVVEAN